MEKPRLHIAPQRQLVMTFALAQSLEILQMPQLELGQWLREEIEKNPLLELDADRAKAPPPNESLIPAPPNLHELLKEQIRDHFPDNASRAIAEELILNLDEKGFLSVSLDALALYFECPLSRIESILSTLQTFDPPGIFARSLQESLLLQLRAKGQSDTPTYSLVRDCFEDLLNGRYIAIKKKLGPIPLSTALNQLARLHSRPAELYRAEPAIAVIPDLRIQKIDTGWTIEVLDDELPHFHIRSEYLDLEPETEPEQESLRSFSIAAKWLQRSLNRRKKLLREIGKIIVCKQARYLDHKGPLTPLLIKDIADRLQIHESTLSRALAGKYISTPRGLLPLRSLVSAAAQSAKEALQRLIDQEDKADPLTDDQLSESLLNLGLKIARRTVVKYRKQLKIGAASQRKNLSRH